MSSILKVTALMLIVLFFQAQAQAQAKSLLTENIKVMPLERFSLKQQVPAMDDYDIRARRIIVPAGASIGEHEHSKRAGIVYVESGSIIEYRGDQQRTLNAGDSLVEDFTTVHAYKNISERDCVLIAFDIPKQG